ncbi:single-stranded-DNA-specific exonuclease RecJ [Halobacteroides halobius DSM 5150]|uniref:Single-stranded-DNA-specific exonuclease RecJ n=1 Tax=Halobacteroides halobius (strain ATCC 35273 / DSM 5150 / MD-1) TaxID=748449 RepID=L0K9S2_HALHC|nr:single-stranded-DNA-specific exonuclease RecJ [Halobacteroides halobius]AGB41761.1 single-stranded-DNA-specific exonuclease RecJ [Halobacteroides halobius DSM 5150]
MQQEVKWERKAIDQQLVEKLQNNLKIDPITAKVLVRRGFDNSKEVQAFFNTTINDLHNPYLLESMERAVARIKKALENKEEIIIYGDYDVDGITSTSLLVDYLTKLGAKVDFYIPNRLTEGYGLNIEAINKLAREGANLVITVDCGIRGHQQVEYANKKGLDVIITDHHTPAVKNPSAIAVVNPKQDNCKYPFSELAGVGVAFKLAQALALELDDSTTSPPLTNYLSLVVLGTVADIVPLKGENRIITKFGLKQLNQINRDKIPGLAALVEVAGYSKRRIKAGNIAFQLAPRINAAGRLGEAQQAVKMLLAADYFQAQQFADQLNDFNDYRKEISEQIFTEAEEAIKQFDLAKEWVLVIASSNWHSGVIGNVASDLQEKYHRPVILIALDGDKGPGSCRSITNFNIYQALQECQDLLIRFGGHKQAAGFSIKEENISQFRKELNDYAHQILKEEDLIPRQKVDEIVSLDQLSFSLLDELETLAPFGYGNSRPTFEAQNLKIQEFQVIGHNKKHLKVFFNVNNQKLEGIAFNQGYLKDMLLAQQEGIDLLFNLARNEWKGQVNLQLRVKDIKIPQPKLKDKLFATKRSILVNGIAKSKLDWFYTRVRELNQQLMDNLSIGQEILLTKESDSQINLIVQGNNLGVLNSELAIELGPYLDVGINYRCFIADLNKDKQLVKVFITRELSKKEKDKAQSTELFFQGQQRIEKLTTPQQRSKLIYDYAVSQATNQEQATLVIWPSKRLVQKQYSQFKRQLPQLNIYQGHRALSCYQEKTLLAAMQVKEVDILIATPEFIQQHRGIITAEFDNLVLADCRSQVIDKNQFKSTLITELQPAKIKIVDKRDLVESKKIEYLSKLLQQGDQNLIFVTNKQESINLASKLEARGNHVLFYNSGLTKKDQKQVIELFSSRQCMNLVTTVNFNPQVKIPGLKNVILYQPSLNQVELLEQVAYLNPDKDKSYLYLLYNDYDLQKIECFLKELAPNRELMKELYIILSKLNKGYGEINISNLELLKKLQAKTKVNLQLESVLIGLGILAELGLITRSKELKQKIRLLPQQKKLDLNSSMRYNECVSVREEFKKFKKTVLNAKVEEMLKLIN